MNQQARNGFSSFRRLLASLVVMGASLAITLPSDSARAASSCTLGAWATTTAMPTALTAATSVTYNGYVYQMGGFSGSSSQSAVYYAPISSNGTVGSWTTSPHSLPQALDHATSVVYKGYVYVMGGSNASVDKTVVYYAQLASDGSVGTWSVSGSPLPVAANSSMALTSNGYVYVMGGRAGSPSLTGVYYAHLNTDGSLGAWVTSSHVLPQGMAYGSAITFGGYAYVMAGYNGSSNLATVYYAALASDGAVGAWTTSSNPLPQSGTSGAAAIANGYAFEIRGGSTNNVYMTALNVNGSTGTWSSVTSLPTIVSNPTAVVYGGHLYVIGGTGTIGNPTTIVYKAPLTGDCAGVPNSDFDSAVNDVEVVAPNAGDANGDAVQDDIQSNVTSLLSPVTGTYTTLASNCAVTSSLSLTSAASQATADAGYTYPAGLAGFSLACTTGATATVTMYYYGLPLTSGLAMRKYNSITHSYAAIPGAALTAVTIGGQAATKVVYQLTDGGALDDDGLANGIIVDPAGPAVLAAATTTAVTAPSTGARPLSSWSYIAAAGLGLALLAYVGRKYYLGDTPKIR